MAYPPITQQHLLAILPNCRPVVGAFVPALNRAMARFDISTRRRFWHRSAMSRRN